MVRTNLQEFGGDVHVLSNLQVGSNLFANDLAANVLSIAGNVAAEYFIGDGGFLSNIATTLDDIISNPNGNSVSNTVVFISGQDPIANTAIVTYANVGISVSNTNPSGEYQLSIGSNIFVNTHASNVLTIIGSVGANTFIGDGGLLSNIATTIDQIIDQGNTVSNTLQLISGMDATSNTGLVTHKDVGISVSNVNPTGEFQFGVGSNLFVNTYSSNVLSIEGNVNAQKMTLGTIAVTSAYGLNHVTAQGSATGDTISLTNATTGLSADSNIVVGGNVTAQTVITSANVEVGDRLKFASNVFVDDLRIADLAANLVTYDKTTGELMDSGGLFANKLAVVSVQPPSALSANVTTVAKHGTYTLTTSGLLAGSNTWNAFDGAAVEWTSVGPYDAGGGVYSGTSNLFAGNYIQPGVSSAGDWLAIEFPYKTTLRHMKLTPPAIVASYPASANIYATNDSLTWTEVAQWGDVDPVTSSNVQTIIVNASESYKRYAMVATKSNGSTSNVALGEWKLFAESFSIDGGQISMAQQPVTGGETMMEQSGPHGRLPKAVPLKKFPEIVFEEGKFDQNHSTNTYVQAGYTVTASSQDYRSSRSPWCAFDDNDSTHQEFNAAVHLYDGGNGTNPGFATTNAVETTNVDGSGTYRGEWLQIELPNKIKLNKYVLGKRASGITGIMPKEAKILGSNDGTNWTTVYDHNDTRGPYSTSATIVEKRIFQVNSSSYYKYFRLATNKLFPTGLLNDNTMTPNIAEWSLYGYEEDIPLGDTSVDTTFTSIMNTPQTTGAQVYVDGSLGETFTNRVVGPTVSNTHTTYVSTEKYWELSGNVESNVTLEANTFLSGDAPHSLSMWFNSSNLEANVSNSCIFSLGTEERLDHVSAAFSNTYQTVQKIVASDGAADDRFGAGDGGNSVGMSGDGSIAVVGAFYDNTKTGATYIFIKDANGSWKEVQKLTASDATTEDRFGCGADISSDGNYIVVGAYLAHSTDGNNTSNVGKIYIFKRNAGTNTWSEQQILASSHESAEDYFGRRVSISSDGTYVVTQAQNDDETVSNGGAAYVFKRTGSTWNTTPFRLISDDIAANDNIATSLEISNDGNFIALGALYESGNNGSVYMFARTGDNTWVQQQKISNPDVSGINNYFGGENQCVSISSDGTYLIVGAYGRASDNGAVFFFQRTGSSTSDWTWSLMGSVQTNPTGATGDLFGRAVKMSPDGTVALVHSRDDVGGTDVGAVFLYKRSGSTWTYSRTIQHKDQTASDYFGSALGISTDGSYFVAGSWHDDDLGTDAGAAYIYTRDTTHHLTTDLKLQSNTWHNLTYAYQGEGGSRVTYLDGRKVAEDQAEDTFGDYPPFAMTGYSQGGYVVSSNYEHGTEALKSYNAFNSTGTGYRWQVNGGYSTSGDYLAVAVNGVLPSITDTNGTPHVGHWLKLELPHKIFLNRFKTTEFNNVVYHMKSYVILGSNDDINWTLLHTETDANLLGGPGGGSHETGISGVTQAFKYLKLLVKSKARADSILLVQEVSYYGHRENDLVRLPDPTNVLKYPHIAMTGPAQRGYVASSSGGYATTPDKAFDGNYESSGGNWLSTAATFSSGVAQSVETFDGSGSAVNGPWLKIEMSRKILPTKLDMFVRESGNSNPRQPRSGVIYGSTDNSSWTNLGSFSYANTTLTGASTANEITLTPSPSGTHYKYFLLHVTQMMTDKGASDRVSITGLEFYGTEEATSVPIQIGGGNIDKVANFRVYDKFIDQNQALEIWDAQKDEFGRAKSSMTLHKGRLGIGTTEPQGRLAVADEPAPTFEPRWPPKPLVGYNTHIEGYGEFVVYRSGNESTGQYRGNSWYIFDDNQDTLTPTYHGERDVNDPINGNYSYFKGTNGEYTGSKSIGGISGDWTVLESPKPIKINDIIRMRCRSASQNTTGFIIAAANEFDGGWTKLTEQSNLVWQVGGVGESKTFHFANDKYYKYYAIIITQAPAQYGYPTLSNMEFSGIVRRQGQSVLHDGQLTLTKNLTVPRIGPALDADDTPRRDRLVVEYNTSTNPTFDGAVRDTSGRGNDGVFVGTASYDATEKNLVTPGNASSAITSGILKHLEGQPTLSYAFWFNQSATNGNNCMIVNLSAEGNYGFPGIGGVFIFSTGILTTTYGGVGIQLDSALSTGVWRHVVAVCDGPSGVDNMTIYINGAKPAQSNWGTTGLVQNLVNPRLRIGGAASGTTDMFDGSISNFKLYDTALTAEEVKTLYDMGRCDEGHHVVNFSKTRVGIGLGDGEAPRAALDVSGGMSRGTFTISQLNKNWWEGGGAGIRFLQYGTDDHWDLSVASPTDDNLAFGYNGQSRGYFRYNGGNVNQNFTGQHRTFIKNVPFSQAGDLEGLVVSSDQNKYIKMSGGIEAGSNAITTNESLPIVSLSNAVTDKKCFGVISASEDPEQREDEYGSFVSVAEKEKGDTRVYINSVGEGAIWVVNTNGSLESGDYITTSNVAGYGQKQESDSLKNYTVAKITMDCDFNPATQPIQQILRSNVIQTYYLGNVHKVKSVPHEFVTTTVGADDAWSNVSVSPSDVTYAEWSNLEANTQNTYTLTYTQTSNVVYDTKYTLTTTANVTESDPWDRVSIDPPSVTYAEYSNLETNTQSSYSLTFTKTTTDEKTPDEWSALESNTQSLYNKVYYQSVEEEVASDYPGATTHTRVTDVIENELDAHGQIQWEDHATETEKAYKIRYLDVSGAQTDSANAVHIAAFVGCTYHCG